jgi:hypothetical protein
MRQLSIIPAAAILVAAIFFQGCSGPSASVPSGASWSGMAPAGRQHPATRASAQNLAVSSCTPCVTFQNGTSAEYLFKTPNKPLRVVTDGIAAPWVGLVFNAAGDLFVANCATCLTGQAGTNNVIEIKPGARKPSVTITDGITFPFALAIDGSGTLYASNLGCYSPSCTGQVSEYQQGYTSGNPSLVIDVKYPLGLALDGSQNLYVANCEVCSTGQTGNDQVLVYPRGSTTPSRTITTGINEPVAMALDSRGDLYVANCINCGLGAAAYLHGTDTVTEYTPSGSEPTKTITFSGTDVPFTLAVNESNDHLFVGNFAVNSVTEYTPRGTAPAVTIKRGVRAPAGLAVDAAGTLYVSNSTANTVTEYPSGYERGRPAVTLPVAYPSSIALSP